MTILKSIIFIFVFLLSAEHIIRAQSFDNAPIIYDQFFKNYFMINPASPDTLDKIRVNIGNRTYTGLFEGVNRLYVDGSIRIKHPTPERYSRLGVLVMNNHDGDYISKSRIYGRYSWSTGLGRRSSLSAGLALGIVSYSFQGSQAGGGGTSSAFDGNLGIWYLRNKIKFGISYQQMVRTVLKPINEKFELAPYYNLNFIYTSDFDAFVSLNTHFFAKYQDKKPVQIEIAPIFLFHEKFEAGLNYRYKNGIALVVGLKSIPIGKGDIRFMASYLLSTKRLSSTLDNVLEFSIGYSL